jgi:hypothetical protein
LLILLNYLIFLVKSQDGQRKFKSPGPDHFSFRAFQPGIFHALFAGYSQLLVSGEKFIACAKGNRNMIQQILPQKLISRQLIAKRAFCKFSSGVFLVGITVAKGTQANQSHAQSDTMHRSWSAV